MFNKVIVAIDKVIDEPGWDEPQKAMLHQWLLLYTSLQLL